MKRQEGTVIEIIGQSSGIIQSRKTGESFFFFADDCAGERMPTEGSVVSFEKDGHDTATNVRLQLDLIAS